MKRAEKKKDFKKNTNDGYIDEEEVGKQKERTDVLCALKLKQGVGGLLSQVWKLVRPKIRATAASSGCPMPNV